MNKYTSRPTQDYMIREGRPGADREFFNRGGGGTNVRESTVAAPRASMME